MTPDRFFTIKELVALKLLPQGRYHLRRVARLQQKDMRRYAGKLPMSWCAVHSFPRFTSVGGRWGIFSTTLEDWRRRKAC